MDISEFTARRRTLTAATGDIAYTESGARPAAVFVHGLATSGALWRHVIEQVDGTTRCIAVDLPLHGGTAPREEPPVTAMAQLIADLCQGLGLDRIDLVGNDTGGAAAQIAAARHPELLRSLVLTNCDTAGNFPPPAFLPVIQAAARGELGTRTWFSGRVTCLRYLAHVIGSPGDWLMMHTLANGQPAAAAYHRDGTRTHHALGVAILTATPAGIARITVFPGGPGLVAKFGFPPTQPERGQ